MIATTHFSFWDDFTDPLKVTFDGVNRLIVLNSQYTTFNVKSDIYSASKRWLQRRDNAKYFPPIRTIGGDPVGGGLYAGDLYFLTNGWQVVVKNTVQVDGILYQDDPQLRTYIIEPGGGVTSTVSNLSYAYSAPGLSALQEQLLVELAKIHGLLANTPLVVTPTTRTAGNVQQTIVESNNTVTVTRVT